MKHERFREQLALRLYGELEPAEAAELGLHLDACADCRAFASELERGLGRLAGAAPAEELSHGWLERLRTSTVLAPKRPRASRAFAFGAAAGLAAGLALAWGIALARASRPSLGPAWVASNAGDSAAESGPELDGPPPRARDGGELARLGGYLRR